MARIRRKTTMTKPVLIIMAAGLGSRYGGLKQIQPVDDNRHILMDYAVYDAKRAGFETVICILSDGMEADFRELYGRRMERGVELKVAIQKLTAVPQGFSLPEGRTKPWGTCQAVLSAKNVVDGPFAVINADDYYGPQAYREIYGFLSERVDKSHYAMVGYRLGNTLTDHGHVARGVCKVQGDQLTEIVEHTRIEKRENGAESFLDDGTSVFLPDDTVVSMNIWGFDVSVMGEIESRFVNFFEEKVPQNPMKAEFLLPSVPNALMQEGKAGVTVLPTADRWFGVTYAPDMPAVQASLRELREAGEYPELLWG
jgi:NDP-sugar pyrophosphorylase family protein